MKIFAILFLGQCVLVYSSPLLVDVPIPVQQTNAKASSLSKNTPGGSVSAASAEASARFTRASLAKANSEAGAGHTSSSAGAAHTPDEVPQVSVQPVPVNLRVPADAAPAPPPPSAGNLPGSNIQSVVATADMKIGTAIATATHKRAVEGTPAPAVPADIQNVKATGDKALATAQNNNSGPGLNVQKAEANGGQLAVASASSGPAAVPAPVARFTRETNSQNVKAQGNKAIATAEDTKAIGPLDQSFQHVEATGGELAVATANSGGAPATMPVHQFIRPAAPATKRVARQSENSTLQVIKAKGNSAISSADAKTTGDVNTTQQVTSDGQKLAVATATKN